MNIVDIVILVVLGISVLYGFYHGFLHTVTNLVAALVSIVTAFAFGPKLAQVFITSPAVTNFLSTYTDSVSRVGDFDLASSSVVGISQNTIDTILRSVKLPESLSKVLEQNLLGQVFSGSGVNSVNSYVSNTIIAASVHVISYLLVFAAAYLILSFLISMLGHVVNFPILKQLDWLAGGIFGVARGAVLIYLLLLLVPLIATVVPDEGVSNLVNASSLAHLFSSDGFFIRVISQ